MFSCEECGELRIKKQSIVIGKKNYCSAKCQNIGNMGTKHSEETKLKISKITKQKLTNPLTIEKMRNAKLGKQQPQHIVDKRTKTMRKIMKTDEYKINHHNSMLGRICSPETREKIADSRRGDKHWTNYLPYTDEHKAKLREARLHQVFPVKDSKIEKMVKLALQLRSIKFRTHEPIIGQPDIYIETIVEDIAIMVDGCFWHGCVECHGDKILDMTIPKANIIRDQKVNNALKLKGIRVVRIWEHEILADPNCNKMITGLINSILRLRDNEFRGKN